jgi:valyl-tRNA synthetase
MDRIDDIMGKWHRHREMEVFLTTFDGAQHLRLHGWLKRNDTLIKHENIDDNSERFGTFMVYITENQLNKLKENNTDNNLFMELEVMSTESERWDLYKGLKNKDAIMESIQDFMFSFQIRNKEDIDKFLIQANETSLALFKKDKAFIKDYVETPEMSGKEKMKDIELMIENFIEQERYEDCALLVKIKEKIIKHYTNKKSKKI